MRSIMLSIICVATITGFARWMAFADDLFLDQRNLFYRQFNTQVAAGHHDAIGFENNFADIGQRFGLFYLGNDLGLAFFLFEFACADRRYLLRCAQRKGHPVQFLLDDKFQVDSDPFLSARAGKFLYPAG